MAELLQTEQVYIRDLQRCQATYLSEMMTSSGVEEKPAGLLDKEAVVFGNIQDICEFHSDVFLRQLVQCQRPADVGRCFVAWAEKFGVYYVSYCQNKPASNRLLQQHRRNFNHVQQKRGLFLGGSASSLDSFLLKPVQRITKYPLLLKDLLSCCDTGEGGEIKDALELMLGILKTVNDAMMNMTLSKPRRGGGRGDEDGASTGSRSLLSLRRFGTTMRWKRLTSGGEDGVFTGSLSLPQSSSLGLFGTLMRWRRLTSRTRSMRPS